MLWEVSKHLGAAALLIKGAIWIKTHKGISVDQLQQVRCNIQEEVTEKQAALVHRSVSFLLGCGILLGMNLRHDKNFYAFAPSMHIVGLRYAFEIWFATCDNLQDEVSPVAASGAVLVAAAMCLATAGQVILVSAMYRCVAIRIALSCMFSGTADTVLWNLLGFGMLCGCLFACLGGGSQSVWWPGAGMLQEHGPELQLQAGHLSISLVGSVVYEYVTKPCNKARFPAVLVRLAHGGWVQFLAQVVSLALFAPPMWFLDFIVALPCTRMIKIITHSIALQSLPPLSGSGPLAKES